MILNIVSMYLYPNKNIYKADQAFRVMGDNRVTSHFTRANHKNYRSNCKQSYNNSILVTKTTRPTFADYVLLNSSSTTSVELYILAFVWVTSPMPDLIMIVLSHDIVRPRTPCFLKVVTQSRTTTRISVTIMLFQVPRLRFRGPMILHEFASYLDVIGRVWTDLLIKLQAMLITS